MITEIKLETCAAASGGALRRIDLAVARSVFQSREFGEFQTTIPYRGKAWELSPGITSSDGGLVIRQKLPLGFSWLWVPYGPALRSSSHLSADADYDESAKCVAFCVDLAQIAKSERAIFARIEPPMGWTEKMTAEVAALVGSGIPSALRAKVCVAKKRFTPEHTLVLDLEQPEEGILAQMKPKGRYNIGVAKRRGVACREFRRFEEIPQGDFEAFYGILEKTAARDEFGIHPKFFYENLLKILGRHEMSSLFLAYDENKRVIAGLIAVFCADTATYYYGASDHSRRELMAPYALQWEAISASKKRGMKCYDFLGIVPDGDKNHPWAGVTDFKLKFGGTKLTYPKAFDIVYKPLAYAVKAW